MKKERNNDNSGKREVETNFWCWSRQILTGCTHIYVIHVVSLKYNANRARESFSF
jgi:hypothetical protein